MLPSVNVMPTALRAYYTQQEPDKGPAVNAIDAEDYVDYHAYTVIDPKTIKDRILNYLGGVLARCWINPYMMKQLEEDPHQCLYEQGIILPDDMRLIVVKARSKDRPRIVIYENDKRICSLQLSMIASR
jgi:predicted phosphatase